MLVINVFLFILVFFGAMLKFSYISFCGVNIFLEKMSLIWECDLFRRVAVLLFPLLIIWYHVITNTPVYSLVGKLVFITPIMFGIFQPMIKKDVKTLRKLLKNVQLDVILAWAFLFTYSIIEIGLIYI
ncbi:hypothetical protein N9N03_02160 [Chlamydiia bacterium]|nr:hypothetical protein [Chlamydiia bacterium]